MININFLHFTRWFLPVTVHLLNRLKDDNKQKIRLNILTQQSKYGQSYDFIQEYLTRHLKDIRYEIVDFPKKVNYLLKIKWSVEQDEEYTIKLDEDCLINNHVWDYLIENIQFLKNNNDIFFLSPTLSNGVPTVEYFIEEFFTEQEKKEIYDMFLKTHLFDIWGVNCTKLNKYTVDAKSWDAEGFYREVDALTHFYKGIHPARLSYECIKYINDRVLEKVDTFLQKQQYEIIKVRRPYFCNSLFAIKTDIYRKIYETDQLFRDGFDEVPINLYMKRKKLKMAFIRNSFGVHPTYKACKDSRIGILQKEFYEKFEKKVLI